MEDGMNVVFLGLGGNVGNTKEILSKARELIETECGTIQLHSSVYETEAWGLQSLNTFLNQVLKLQTQLSYSELIQKLLAIEVKLGRIRVGEGYEDRIIDIDILLFNTEIIETKALIVPHPRLHLRKFVLIPFCEIAASQVHPVLHQTMQELLSQSADTLEVRKYLN